MRRLWSDLHIGPGLRDTEQVSGLVSKASELGYRLVAVTFSADCDEEDLRSMQNDCRSVDVDVATRVDLRPRTPNELTRDLRRLRRKFEIIAVMCESKNLSRQAAKDRRVDLLNFPSIDFRTRFFDMAEAELASNSLASLEMDMRPLLTLEGRERIRLLSSLRKEATIARDFHVPIVLSSGVSNGLLLRKPMELAALASLFDLDKDLALDAVSKSPVTIVKRNREKLGSRFVAPGIQVIRRGKDC
jgi:RNase P/RNase MRP subunit p30